MRPGVLSRYLASRFARTVLGVFLGVLGLIFTLDFVDTLRRAGEHRGVGGPLVAWLAVLHTPIVAEQALPFIVLIGAMATFLTLSRRLELVVARAAGVSAWAFLAPAVALSLAFGLIEIIALNPLSTAMKRQAAGIEAKIFGAAARDAGGFWLRQKTPDGQAILHVEGRDAQSHEFLGIEVFNFDPDNAFVERIDAKRGALREGYWELTDVEVVTPGETEAHVGRYLLATAVTAADIARSIATPETASIYELNGLIGDVESAGLDATAYRMRRQQLLALPLTMMSMTLIAACFSLRLFRMGGVQRMVLSGVAAGFVLYVVSKIIGDLGAAGFAPAPIAAWSPAIGGSLFGVYVLLHQEDG